jgi:hypothetical protein
VDNSGDKILETGEKLRVGRDDAEARSSRELEKFTFYSLKSFGCSGVMQSSLKHAQQAEGHAGDSQGL